MKKFLHVLYQPYKWLIFFPLFALFTCILVLIGVMVLLIFDDYAANRTTGVWWARLTGYITPILVKVHGREHIKKKQSYIIVSNHQSMYDVLVLYGWLGVDLKWVIKKELRKVPVIGFAAEKGGNIFIDRSDPKAAYESLRQARKKVVNGTSIIILPEGTRSRNGEVGEFKKGAFWLARELKLPILPVTIMNTGNILPTGTFNLFPGRAVMKVHQPMDTAACDEASFDDLIVQVRNIIKDGLDEK
ncbi:MAG TPA: lysophospholipid acyltransferase family protein [Spirochaetota bacterium]|nr:lysophospholipid acyltransferase family protein [Spirochaetota bacterium]HPC40020.1 lysophospholipid acyltransferase family protein [Spirochaetota bacterium]HPL15189.1 lysophospholipid acyltransferase family protein [Spirochaetota bacterium]HQF09899.1 lysophospholipid acyltransferase family protein [Spirochaetota bacterium]HQH98550.1 lysophospholipid acyltransferase family protein [Spirochaetota bacterium]